jgi:DNA invertase Pin-like site-specific DNA recombinase
VIVGYFRLVDLGGEDAVSPTTVLRAERCLRIESDEPGRWDARRALIRSLSNGDVLVSPTIAHLAVSITELLRVAASIHAVGATLRLVAERIDTSVPAARNTLAMLAEYDRRLLTARRNTGVREAELRGASPGRPRKLDDRDRVNIRNELAGGRTYASVARELGVHPTTVMRLMQRDDTGDEG